MHTTISIKDSYLYGKSLQPSAISAIPVDFPLTATQLQLPEPLEKEETALFLCCYHYKFK